MLEEKQGEVSGLRYLIMTGHAYDHEHHIYYKALLQNLHKTFQSCFPHSVGSPYAFLSRTEDFGIWPYMTLWALPTVPGPPG